MSRKAEFHRCLSKLTYAAADPNPIVSAAARTALDNVLAEAERLWHVLEAETLALEGWEQAGKGSEPGPDSV
jgi:hypothetical protein